MEQYGHSKILAPTKNWMRILNVEIFVMHQGMFVKCFLNSHEKNLGWSLKKVQLVKTVTDKFRNTPKDCTWFKDTITTSLTFDKVAFYYEVMQFIITLLQKFSVECHH